MGDATSNKEEILASVQAVPALPSSASKVIALAQDPDVDMAELLRAIEYDQGLTSNVLRMANSAFFAGPNPIASLRDAVVRLGLNRLYQLVMTSVVSPLARSPVSGYDLAAGELSRHSVFVAVCCEEIAKKTGERPPAAAFTAGLLHDVGKIVLGTFLKVDVAPVLKLAQEQNLSFERAEKEVLGLDHAETGAALLESWKLPEDILAAVRWHHDPDSFTGGDSHVVDLVHVADILSMQAGIGTGVDGLNYLPSQRAAQRLSMRPLACEEVLCRTMTALDGLSDLLTVNSRKE